MTGRDPSDGSVEDDVDRRGPGPGRFFLLLALPTIVGTALRFHRLADQVLGGDELHALRAALTGTLPELLYHFRPVDPCLPLSSLFHLLLQGGWVPGELGLRAPILLGGVLTVPIAGLAFRRWIGDGRGLVLAWLVAISPMLVLYSRIVRPYGLVVLAVLVALAAFLAWIEARKEKERWVFGALFVMAAASAVYLHLGVAPLLAAPFLFGLGDLAWGPPESRGRRLRRLVFLGGALALAMATFLIPGAPSLQALLEQKRAEGGLRISALAPTLLSQVGTLNPWAAAVLWVGALVGLVRLFREHLRLALYTVVVVVTHLVGLEVLSPFGLFSEVVTNRYLLALTPLFLLWLALALPNRIKGWTEKSPLWATSGLLVGAMFLLGPFPTRAYRTSSFLHHNHFLSLGRSLAESPAGGLPAAYDFLRGGAPGAVVEAPHLPIWRACRFPYAYQQIHRRRVLLATPDPLACSGHQRLGSLLCLEADTILASDARFLLLHMNPKAEEEALGALPLPRVLAQRSFWQDLGGQARVLRRELLSRWGRPQAVGDGVLLWDLERVRARLGTAEPSSP